MSRYQERSRLGGYFSLLQWVYTNPLLSRSDMTSISQFHAIKESAFLRHRFIYLPPGDRAHIVELLNPRVVPDSSSYNLGNGLTGGAHSAENLVDVVADNYSFWQSAGSREH